MTLMHPQATEKSVTWEDLTPNDQMLCVKFEDLIWHRVKSNGSNVSWKVQLGKLDLSDCVSAREFFIVYNGRACSLTELLHVFLWMNDLDHIDQVQSYIAKTKHYFIPKADVTNISRDQIVFLTDADKETNDRD